MKNSGSVEAGIRKSVSVIEDQIGRIARELSTAKAQGEKSSVCKSLSKEEGAIESARKSAGENRKNKSGRSASYSAAILKQLNDRNDTLGVKFLARFEANLSITRNCNKEAIKPAAHQALNDLVRRSELGLEDVKKITHSAWRSVYGDLSLHANKSVQRAETADLRGASSGSSPAEGLGILARQSSPSESPLRSNHKTVQSSSAPGGFLWKPVADRPPHGLAVLLPADWTGSIAGLQIVDPHSGEILATGRDGGVGNGERQHFRFDRQGGDFPNGAIVRVMMKDGAIREIAISNTGARLEGRSG